MTTLKIIDVSQWQGLIDWQAAKGAIYGAVLRLGYGSDDETQDDKQFARNVAECKRLSIPVEAYIYSYAYTEAMAKSEAAHAVRLLKGTGITRVWYDLEESKYGSYAKTCMAAFSDAAKAAGYDVGLYTYESYYNAYLKGVTDWPVWCAKYASTKPRINADLYAWQYTSGAAVPGISGRVDCSEWYGAFAVAKKTAAAPSVYRLYRQNRHYYTTDPDEWADMVTRGWKGEGVGWKAPKNGNPVYRYTKGQEHIWTMDAEERKALAADGWTKDGIAFRSNVNKAVPIYRLYLDGDRVYTRLLNERKALLKAGWRDEGVAFYGRT